jgi:hypothetical protein
VAGEKGPGGEGIGALSVPAPPEGGGDRGPAWWRLRPWSGILIGGAAVALLAIGFLAGDAVGHSGAPGPATAAATSPSVSVAATPTPSSTQLVASPGTSPSSSAIPTSDAPTASPTPPAPSTPPVFQAFTSTNCETAVVPDYECGPVEVAQFTGGGSVAQYTAQVTFATSVQIPATTDGKPEVTVVAQAGTTGAFLVGVGELTFPGPGTYAYTVTVTNMSNGDTASWQGSMPVGG